MHAVQSYLKQSFGSWYEPLHKLIYADAFMKAFAKYSSLDGLKPPRERLLRAFELCPYESLKLVIIGQDPYFSTHKGAAVANGMAFSVDNGVPPPPSLRNILKTISADIGIKAVLTDFAPIARQGVLWLNASLCVHNKALDCADFGFLGFSDSVIAHIDERFDGVVFLLWGGFAKAKAALISRNTYLSSSHPSPLSAHKKNADNFLEQRHFSTANKLLASYGKTPINWSVLANI